MFPHGLSLKSAAAWIKRSVSGTELGNETINIKLWQPQPATHWSTEVLRLSSSFAHSSYQTYFLTIPSSPSPSLRFFFFHLSEEVDAWATFNLTVGRPCPSKSGWSGSGTKRFLIPFSGNCENGMIETPSGISGNGGNLIKGAERSGGGFGPWGGTTVAVSPDISIPVAIALRRSVAEGVNTAN